MKFHIAILAEGVNELSAKKIESNFEAAKAFLVSTEKLKKVHQTCFLSSNLDENCTSARLGDFLQTL
jgi:hypothetical protein